MEQERPNLLKQRRDWCDSRARARAPLVFIDETGLRTSLTFLNRTNVAII